MALRALRAFKRTQAARGPPAPRSFLVAFATTVLAGVLLIVAGHFYLAHEQVLPSPPLTATPCINDRFAFLRSAPLETAQVMAVGSSTTWRNLDMPMLSSALGAPTINVASCYLHAHQTRYLASFLFERAPQLEILLVVFHPRDFESCAPGEETFFDQWIVAGFVDHRLPAWLPYVTGFRPKSLLLEAHRIAHHGPGHNLDVVEDPLGSSVLRSKVPWHPDLKIDPRCFAALPELEAAALRHAARLVVVTMPTMPSWATAEDPAGTKITAWREMVRANLTHAETILVDGASLAVQDSMFADPVHFVYPYHKRFTSFIAHSILSHVSPKSG